MNYASLSHTACNDEMFDETLDILEKIACYLLWRRILQIYLYYTLQHNRGVQRPIFRSVRSAQSIVSYYWLKFTYAIGAFPYIPIWYATLERIFVQRYVTAPFFQAQVHYIRVKPHHEIFAVSIHHFPYMQMNLDTCAMTATRSVEHLWRARSNRGGVGADHNSLIVFQIRDNRRSAPAIGNLLLRVCANNSLFVILIAQCFIATFSKLSSVRRYENNESVRQIVQGAYLF